MCHHPRIAFQLKKKKERYLWNITDTINTWTEFKRKI